MERVPLKPKGLDVWMTRPSSIGGPDKYIIFMDGETWLPNSIRYNPTAAVREWLGDGGCSVYTSGTNHLDWGRWFWDCTGKCWGVGGYEVELTEYDLVYLVGSIDPLNLNNCGGRIFHYRVGWA